MRIVPFTPERTQGVFDLIVPIQQNEFGIDITAEQQPDLADIGGFYQQGLGNFWVALNDAHEVVGSVSLKDIGNNDVALRKMFVRADCRGGALGVSKALLQTALDWAQTRGVQAIYLGTTPFFVAAHRFYEKNGFVKIEEQALPSSFPIMHVDKIFYRYDVAASGTTTDAVAGF